MTNLSRAIALLDSNPAIGHAIARFNMPNNTPPNNLRELIDSIASARGVTLYKGKK